MTRIGQKRVAFSKIIVPGSVNLKQLMASERVRELAKSCMEDSGGRPLQPPTLDAKTYRLVTGADRLAAMKVNGDQSSIFEMVEGTEQELRRLSIAENLRRRNDDQQKLAARLVESAEIEIMQGVDSGQCPVSTQCAETGHCPESTRRATRPKTVRGAAIEKVASETGKTEAAIKKAVQREEAKKKSEIDFVSTTPKSEPAELPAPLPPIRTFGANIDGAIIDSASEARDMIDELSKLFASATAKMTAYEKRFPQLGQQQRAREGLQSASHALRAARPESVCPHCKATEQMKRCLVCKGLGFVPKASLVDCPKELLVEGDEAGIYIDGKWCLLLDMEF